MTKPVAVFLAVAASLVTVYFAIADLVLGQDDASSAEVALVKGLWVAFGASAIVAVCGIFEALSERLPTDSHD